MNPRAFASATGFIIESDCARAGRSCTGVIEITAAAQSQSPMRPGNPRRRLAGRDVDLRDRKQLIWRTRMRSMRAALRLAHPQRLYLTVVREPGSIKKNGTVRT